MSFGTLSWSNSLSACLASRLSFERALCVMAALWREPSGFWSGKGGGVKGVRGKGEGGEEGVRRGRRDKREGRGEVRQ